MFTLLHLYSFIRRTLCKRWNPKFNSSKYFKAKTHFTKLSRNITSNKPTHKKHAIRLWHNNDYIHLCTSINMFWSDVCLQKVLRCHLIRWGGDIFLTRLSHQSQKERQKIGNLPNKACKLRHFCKLDPCAWSFFSIYFFVCPIPQGHFFDSVF